MTIHEYGLVAIFAIVGIIYLVLLLQTIVQILQTDFTRKEKGFLFMNLFLFNIIGIEIAKKAIKEKNSGESGGK